MDEYQRFLQFIEIALINIEDEYFRTQYHQFYAFRDKLSSLGTFNGTTFIRHNERGFAYELYYHLRAQIIQYRKTNNFFPGYYLQGEIKKWNVEEVLKAFGYKHLGGGLIPDLLFHVPSDDANAFVIEIKAQPELEDIEILFDLNKLARFLQRFNYRKAIFLAVNISSDIIVDAIKNNRIQIKNLFNERTSDCHIVVKQSSGATELFNKTIYQIIG